MTKRRIPERDAEIVYKKDALDWSFRQIARLYGMSVSSVHEAYYRAKPLRSVVKVKAGK